MITKIVNKCFIFQQLYFVKKKKRSLYIICYADGNAQLRKKIIAYFSNSPNIFSLPPHCSQQLCLCIKPSMALILLSSIQYSVPSKKISTLFPPTYQPLSLYHKACYSYTTFLPLMLIQQSPLLSLCKLQLYASSLLDHLHHSFIQNTLKHAMPT